MSEDTVQVSTSELQTDSEILGMELCVDDSDNWVVRYEGLFLTEDGELIEPEGGQVPEIAVYSTVIKAQSAVQQHGEDAKQEHESEVEDEEVEEEVQTEEDSDSTDEVEGQSEDSQETGTEEFEEDAILFTDESEDETEDVDFENIDEEDEAEGVVNEQDDLFSEPEGVDATGVDEEDMDESDDGLVDRIKSLGSSDEESPEDNQTEEDQHMGEDSSDEGIFGSFFGSEPDSSEHEEESEPDDSATSDEEDSDEGGFISSISGMFGSDGREEEDTMEIEEESGEEQIETEAEKEVTEENEAEKEEQEDGIMSSVSGVFTSEENADVKESDESEKDKEVNTESNEDEEFQPVDQDDSAEDSEEQDEVEDEENGIIQKISSMFEEDETQDLMEEDEKEPLLEKTKRFFSAEIADVDQDRPDAQNVSIDFFGDSTTWSDTMNDFWDKLRKAKDGDTNIRKDLKTDLRTRYFALIKRNSYARGDILDFVFMFSLALMGISIIAIGIGASLSGNIRASEVLNQTSSYGDHMMMTTIVLSIASVSFWLSRRASSETVVSVIRKPARAVSGLILTLQVLVVGFVGYSLTLGGGQDALLAIELAMDDAVRSITGLFSGPVAPVGDAIRGLYFSYRGTSNTIFGLSIVEASVFMTVVGLITAYPVLKRSIARFILTANMGPREFREKTGILIEELSEGTDSDEYEGPRYVMGGEDSSDGEVTSGESGQAVVSQEEAYGQITLENEEETEGLLALPENVKGSPFKNYEEVRRYWVRAPYAYVSIVYNERQNDYRYVVVEPELDESEKVIFDELNERLDTVLLFEDVEEKEDHEKEQQLKLKKLEKKMIELSDEYDIDINDETFHRLMYYIERDYVYYNKIDPLINDPNVEDISCDGEDQYIFVFHSDYKDVITNVKFGRDELRSFIQELAQRSGEHISAADPMVDASLPDGSRAQMTLGTEVTTHGSTFTIRLFEEIPFTPVDLLDYDTFSLTQMAYLWTAIEHNKSLIFAGGTASGKTTSMNAVSMFIPPKAKVITIEDTREISLPQKNWIPGTTREGVGGEEGGDDIDMYELLRAALRQRPEYIVVGEIRGREAETLFQAMNTGHTTYSTMHAETVDAAIGRLTNPPINVPKQMITALDIICIQNQIRFTDEDGNAVNVRRNEETREIVSLRDNGQFENRRPFQWDAETDTFIQSLEDSHVLARIAEENGWTPEDKRKELKQREEVLEYMLEEDIREFEYVSNIIQAYMVDPEKIMREVRNDTLEPSELKSLTDMEWEEPDETLNELASGDEDEMTAAQEAGDNT